MKYLKLFESEEFSEVSEWDFYMDLTNTSLISNQVDNLNNNDLFQIKSLLGDGDYRLDILGEPSKSKKSKLEVYIEPNTNPNYKWLYGTKYEIVKLIDEWYMMRIATMSRRMEISSQRYYKCDQLEGLLDCIKKSQSF